MKAERLLFRIAIATLLLCSLSLGGLDQSGNVNAKNMTISDFNTLVPLSDAQDSFVDTGAPWTTPAEGGTEMAVFSEQAPPAADLEKLMPSAILKDPPRYMYYNGNYLPWNDFSTTYPSHNPGLWIERAVSWTLYATLPRGGWTRELIYVPQASPVNMYEIYPGGFVLSYSLGMVQSGFYYIWFYADTSGRHRSLFSTNSGYSNAVTTDVYPAGNYIKINPTPKPSPKEECEKQPLCKWENGGCICQPAPNPVAECEKNSLCHWVDGQCLCTGDVDTEKEKCEASPTCDWVNGNCYCRGGEPEPMPGPVPNPNPEPEPEPFNPAPNPVVDNSDNGIVNICPPNC